MRGIYFKTAVRWSLLRIMLYQSRQNYIELNSKNSTERNIVLAVAALWYRKHACFAIISDSPLVTTGLLQLCITNS